MIDELSAWFGFKYLDRGVVMETKISTLSKLMILLLNEICLKINEFLLVRLGLLDKGIFFYEGF